MKWVQETCLKNSKCCDFSSINLVVQVVICDITWTRFVVNISQVFNNFVKHIICAIYSDKSWIVCFNCCFSNIEVTFVNFCCFVINSCCVLCWIIEWSIVNIFNIIDKECFITSEVFCDCSTSRNELVGWNQVSSILEWVVSNCHWVFIIVETFIVCSCQTINSKAVNCWNTSISSKVAESAVCNSWVIPQTKFWNSSFFTVACIPARVCFVIWIYVNIICFCWIINWIICDNIEIFVIDFNTII